MNIAEFFNSLFSSVRTRQLGLQLVAAYDDAARRRPAPATRLR